MPEVLPQSVSVPMLVNPFTARYAEGEMLTAGDRFGPYQIEDLVGEGGMGHVYRAIQHPLGRTVALKLLRPDFGGDGDAPIRFAREMRSEGLPSEFIETIETGWWTTCLEILPAKERARGKF